MRSYVAPIKQIDDRTLMLKDYVRDPINGYRLAIRQNQLIRLSGHVA